MTKYFYDPIDTTGDHPVPVVADFIHVHDSGALVFSREVGPVEYSSRAPELIIAPGAWQAAWADFS